MRFLNPVAVFVIAVMTAQGSLNAADDIQAPPPTPYEVAQDASTPQQAVKTRQVSATTGQPHLHQVGIQPNGFDQFRREPDLGSGHSPSYGYKHFPLPLNMFGSWYRPRASTLTVAQRCAPDDFRPRGFGHTFARPCDSFRMEYSPYTVKENRSEYGPAYLRRAPDPRCNDCNHCR
ncbi:MAG: hypothetical protein ABJZ55_08200 [Fuerstiella sp.]